MALTFTNPNGIQYVFDREDSPYYSKRDADGNITMADPADRSETWRKAQGIQALNMALNPDWRPKQGTTNWFETAWNNFVLRGGGSPNDLAAYINRLSNGSIKVSGDQLAQLAKARDSNYTGDLPDTIAGLEEFYNKGNTEKIRQDNINAQIKKYFDLNNTFGPQLQLDTSGPAYSLSWNNGVDPAQAVDTSWITFNPNYRRTDKVVNPNGPLVNPFAPAAPVADTAPTGAFSPSADDTGAGTADGDAAAAVAPEAPLSAPGAEAKAPRTLNAPGMLSSPVMGGGSGFRQPAARGAFKVGQPNEKRILRSRGLFSA